jgi:uncharacterized protein YjbI with pentapeptide repeats
MTNLALVIGIAGYDSPYLPPLASCKKDAEDMMAMLSKLGYNIAENVPVDGIVLRDYGWANIRETIGNFFLDAKSNQTLVFYFSGHGIAQGEEVYLCTPQTDPKKPSIKGFSLSDLTSLMSQSRSIRIVCIIDACYSGAAKLPDSKMKSKAAAEDDVRIALSTYDKVMDGVPKTEGRCLLLSGQAYEESFAMEGTNSFYTKYLLEGLAGKTATGNLPGSVDSDGNVTPDSLHYYIYHHIAEMSTQIPRLKVDKTSKIILASYPKLALRIEQSFNEALWELLRNGKTMHFNSVRKKDYLASVDFNRRNLAGLNLDNAHLFRVNLRGANLEGASIQLANLYGADLMDSILNKVNLSRSSLKHATLENAKIIEANLEYTYIDAADLQFADLTGASLKYASLHGADLRNTVLNKTNLYETFRLPISREEAIARGAIFRP